MKSYINWLAVNILNRFIVELFADAQWDAAFKLLRARDFLMKGGD